MYLTIFDLVLILAMFVFITFGFTMGLVESIGALIGVVFGTWIAGMYYEPLSVWFESIFLGGEVAARVIAFILIFSLVNRLIGLVFWLVNKIFNLVSIIPFTKTLNRFLGAFFGLVEGTLAIGTIIYFISETAPIEWWEAAVEGSKVAKLLIGAASVITPLLPDIVKAVL